MQHSTPQRSTNVTKLAVLAALTLFVAGFLFWSISQSGGSGAQSPANSGTSRIITRADLGEAWPFTVEQGMVLCVGGEDVVFAAEGVTYGVNGSASAGGQYKDIEAIRRPDPADPRYPMSLQPILDVGLPLCR